MGWIGEEALLGFHRSLAIIGKSRFIESLNKRGFYCTADISKI